MRIGIVAPPFIPVPPKVYGGTELFVANLAEGLKKLGVDVVVYCNGESTVKAERRWLFRKSEWPIKGEIYAHLKDMNHNAWAVADAVKDCDLVHLNSLPGLVHTPLVKVPIVYTIHHAYEPGLSSFYEHYPEVNYVAISRFQKSREKMRNLRIVHHGIDLSVYKAGNRREYLSFLGRIAPMKGTHLAIDVAKRCGIPLKIAGEVQPMFKEYFETKVRPHVDGRFIEYVGEVGLAGKNELLGRSIALLFPIQWDEPFGLVMVEAMACGAPVLALPGGAVREVVVDGVSGMMCRSVEEMARYASTADRQFNAERVRSYTNEHFSIELMVDKYLELYREVAGMSSASVASTSNAASNKVRAIA